jgi:hypothetical protein
MNRLDGSPWRLWRHRVRKGVGSRFCYRFFVGVLTYLHSARDSSSSIICPSDSSFQRVVSCFPARRSSDRRPSLTPRLPPPRHAAPPGVSRCGRGKRNPSPASPRPDAWHRASSAIAGPIARGGSFAWRSGSDAARPPSPIDSNGAARRIADRYQSVLTASPSNPGLASSVFEAGGTSVSWASASDIAKKPARTRFPRHRDSHGPSGICSPSGPLPPVELANPAWFNWGCRRVTPRVGVCIGCRRNATQLLNNPGSPHPIPKRNAKPNCQARPLAKGGGVSYPLRSDVKGVLASEVITVYKVKVAVWTSPGNEVQGRPLAWPSQSYPRDQPPPAVRDRFPRAVTQGY